MIAIIFDVCHVHTRPDRPRQAHFLSGFRVEGAIAGWATPLPAGLRNRPDDAADSPTAVLRIKRTARDYGLHDRVEAPKDSRLHHD